MVRQIDLWLVIDSQRVSMMSKMEWQSLLTNMFILVVFIMQFPSLQLLPFEHAKPGVVIQIVCILHLRVGTLYKSCTHLPLDQQPRFSFSKLQVRG